MYAIETNNLTKKYKNKTVVDKVNLFVPEGSIFGFVGENGAGKTTIMRLLTGLSEPSGGSYKLFDVSNTDRKIYETRSHISAIVESTSLIPTMNAMENLKFAYLYLGLSQEIDFNQLLKTVGLIDVGNKKVKDYSLGMRQRLGIALALLNEPRLLLLDEPMNGLDPEGIAELRDLLINLNKKGITILISSHILSELEKIATHYGILSHGRLIKTITSEELHSDVRKSKQFVFKQIDGIEKVLKLENIKDYKITNNTLTIFNEFDLSSFINSLVKNNYNIIDIISKDESIEDYYLSLLKEER
ncbi:MAG: ATP-binding cassette domain-containing protein [Bacilli bacterium]|nr:ATP-binding cassette domain-containing protein [Bacilli bacterium]MDY5669801.1 ATP-binding cassette domain-containing protein [Bacilli bacterium]